MIITLKFENRTAEDCIEMQVDRYAAGHIMDWYGAFYAGDDYDVFISGRRQELGINGELEPVTVDGEVIARARSFLKENGE
jgi:hypothetical protein